MIDDEPAIRESLHALLTLEGGYSVDLAEGGVEGLQKLAKRGYDLVLLDLMMPDMSGMEVLHDLRERDRETPIFMAEARCAPQPPERHFQGPRHRHRRHRLYPEAAATRQARFANPTRKQGWLFFPLLFLVGLGLQIDSIKFIFQRAKVTHRSG